MSIFLYNYTDEADMQAACDIRRPMVITIFNRTDISSPKYPENYEHDLNCAWRLVTGDATRIELSLKGDGDEIERE